jgi:hypothetical protein
MVCVWPFRWKLLPLLLEEAVRASKEGRLSLDLRFFATVINACAEAHRPDEALAVGVSKGQSLWQGTGLSFWWLELMRVFVQELGIV